MKTMNQSKPWLISALFGGSIYILSSISIPLPGMIPITLMTLGVYISSMLQEKKFAVMSILIFLILGPFARIPTITGGYLYSLIPASYFISHMCYQKEKNAMLSLLFASLLIYTIGTIHFILMTKSPLMNALLSCVIPFLPGDCIKIIISVYMNKKIKKYL